MSNCAKGKSKGSRRTNRRQNKVKPEYERATDTVQEKDNNPSWYSVAPELVKSAASLSYARAIGTRFDRGLSDPFVDAGFDDAIPGVAVFRYTTCPGISDSGDSPVMVAARKIYSYVRHQNSGSKNYEAVDLMLYLLSMDSVYTMLATLVRMYGVARLYSQGNRYLPEALLAAMDVDPTTLSGNLEDFRGKINVLIQKAGSLAVPKSMPFFERHAWMASHIYADNPNVGKSQLYFYHPYNYYIFKATAEDTGGMLEYQALSRTPSNPWSYSELCEKVNQMLAALIEDEDSNVMSGDILKAYGADGLWKMNYIATDYVVMPEYSPEVLTQINNLTVTNGAVENTWSIHQEDGILRYEPEFTISGLARGKLLLNMPMDVPTPDDTMVATRLMVTLENADVLDEAEEGVYLVKPNTLGSEFIAKANVYTYTWVNGYRQLVVKDFDQFRMIEPVFTTVAAVLSDVAYISKFSAHPRLYYAVLNDEQVPILLPTIGDTGTYALVGEYEITNMNNTALLSMFNVPIMGMWAQQ